jgi:Spy/CpxP family protein refolding chaperone
MLRVASIALAVIASLVLVDSLSAQQNRQGPGRRGGYSVIDRVERVKDLKLTDDQKAKLADLKKAYAPKLKELSGTLDKVLTADQKKARDEAIKAAREAHKRGPEVRESIQAAMKLTDAQKAKLAEGRKAMGTLNKEIGAKVNKILTPEQQDVLKKARATHGNRGGHRNHGNGGNSQPPSQVN